MMITMQGKYQTRGESGLLEGKHPSVRILCVDGPSDEPVIGIIEGRDEPCQWTIDGHFWVSGVGSECDRDLVSVPTKHEMWAVVYADGDYRTAVRDRFLFSTEAFAQGAADTENREHPSLTHGKAHVVLVTWED